jgi:alpha-amylase/alpha-mannosidase (GH57 family)
MSESRPLDVVFCWHMHQPQYRRAIDGSYQLPWTYLHAIKDYPDMAWYLEHVPGARAVVNFTPVLLDQIDDYRAQFAARAFRDPLLRALQAPAAVPADDRPAIVEGLFRANVERMILRYPEYRRLRETYQSAHGGDRLGCLSDGYLGDLAVWYHLAWLGETIKRTDDRAQRLRAKGADFDDGDRSALLALMGETIDRIVPRYRALAEAGRIELSTSPYAHPIVPLLIDFAAAHESLPNAPLPGAARYPGGVERAAAHLDAARKAHRSWFGAKPAGCWPSEGAISSAATALFADAGFTWTASCESVLGNSLRAGGGALSPRAQYLYKPYVVGGADRRLPCFFRDVHLSDLIGFRYADWHGDDAVANFVSELEAIADATAGDAMPIVSVILDGENAWEHYPENGYYLLSGLYRAIAAHPRLRLTTFAEHLARAPVMETLDTLVAGSWVYGTLSTWIGEKDKNQAWDLLVHAKTDFDAAVASGRLAGDRLAVAERQLKVCEGSDWFWWFGDYNPAQTVSDFDTLFRDHIRDLYALIGVQTPPEVDAVIGVGAGAPTHGGTMRENPALDASGR